MNHVSHMKAETCLVRKRSVSGSLVPGTIMLVVSTVHVMRYGAVSTPKIKVQLDDMMVDILNTLLCLQDTMVWPHN